MEPATLNTDIILDIYPADSGSVHYTTRNS